MSNSKAVNHFSEQQLERFRKNKMICDYRKRHNKTHKRKMSLIDVLILLAPEKNWKTNGYARELSRSGKLHYKARKLVEQAMHLPCSGSGPVS